MFNDVAEFKVGVAAPDFSVDSDSGTLIHLSDYLGKKHVVLYFMRQFACMFCQFHAAQLARIYDQFQAQDAEILIIGGGSRKDAERLSKSLKLPFPVLADHDRGIYLRYGLDKIFGTVQRSGTFLIDKQGVLSYIHQVTNPQASVDKTELLNELKKLQALQPD